MNNKFSMFGVTLDAWSMDETVAIIGKRLSQGIFTQHVVVNVAKMVHAQKDAVLKKSITSCDIVNIDGMGVVWGARILGFNVPERVAGVDLFYKLIELSERESFPVFLLGAENDVVVQCAKVLMANHPDLKIAGYHHGFFWQNEKEVVAQIRESGAKLLFVAITSPKKENFINRWEGQLGVDFVMGVGGTFDVVAGKVTRAPVWMQQGGLEWLYRVFQEPRRMWKRYLVTNTVFVLMLIRGVFSKKYREEGVSQPI